MTNKNRDIDLTGLLTKQIGSLYMSENCSDITLLIEGHKIPAHRSIIGARCEYLKNFFATNLNEPNQTIFDLNCHLKSFQILLEYFYTGQMPLTKIKDVEILLQILKLVEEYCLLYLKSHFEKYFMLVLSIENVCQLLKAAKMYELNELEFECFNLIENNPDEILANESFKKISKELLEEILRRDSFCPSSELCIFNAIIDWSKQTNQNIEIVLHLVNLSLIPLKELLKIRNCGNLTEKMIFDAMEKQLTEKPLERSVICKPNENVATSKYNAQTIEGYTTSQLLNGNFTLYNDSNGYTRHSINDINRSGIIVELGKIFKINHIKMLLWDRDNRSYSYFIEISTDKRNWKRIIDYSTYHCRSWQNLYFPAKPIKYIKIVGTHCSENNYFDIVTLKAYYRETIPEIKDGIVVPKKNVALVDMGAIVIQATDWDNKINDVINGDPYSGWTGHSFSSDKNISIRLSQPFRIGSIRLLFDNTWKKSYKFYVETSLNNKDWKEVANTKNEFVTSWQTFHFLSRPVLFIRIVGTNNGIISFDNFKVNHFECPAQIENYPVIKFRLKK